MRTTLKRIFDIVQRLVSYSVCADPRRARSIIAEMRASGTRTGPLHITGAIIQDITTLSKNCFVAELLHKSADNVH